MPTIGKDGQPSGDYARELTEVTRRAFIPKLVAEIYREARWLPVAPETRRTRMQNWWRHFTFPVRQWWFNNVTLRLHDDV